MKEDAPDPILNEYGMTELHIAAYEGDLEWVQNCIKGGLSVHARNYGGYTPLHWNADMGITGDPDQRKAIVAALIEAGADVNAVDKLGRSALEVARLAGNEEIIQQLIAAGAQ